MNPCKEEVEAPRREILKNFLEIDSSSNQYAVHFLKKDVTTSQSA